MAIFAPFLFRWHKKIQDHSRYFLGLLLVYAFYEVSLIYVAPHLHGKIGSYLSSIIFYALPYCLLFAYGLRMDALKSAQHIAILGAAFVVFAAFAFFHFLDAGEFVQTQKFKYPPSAYYLSFALVGCQILWLVGPYIYQAVGRVAPIKKFIIFVGQNTLWIYLWHIPILRLIEMNFAVKYVAVFALATLIAAAQNRMINQIVLPRIPSAPLQKNIRTVFTG